MRKTKQDDGIRLGQRNGRFNTLRHIMIPGDGNYRTASTFGKTMYRSIE